ncbi:MAG: ABC transporter ATP-binding protein [Candidatus Brocadiia bacterium]
MTEQLKKLYALFGRSDKIKFGILVLLMVIVALSELAGIGIIPAFLGAIVYPEEVLAYPVVGETLKSLNIDTPRRLLLTGSGAILIVFLVKNALAAFNSALQARYTTNRMAGLRIRLFSAYMNAPYPFFLQRNSSELLRNANQECREIADRVLMPLLRVLTKSVVLLLVLTMLLIVQPVATAVMICVLGLAGGGFVLKLHHRIREYGRIAVDERNISNKCLQQGVEGIKEARVLGCEQSFTDAFGRSARNAARSQRYKQIIRKVIAPLLETIGVLTMLVLALVLVWGFDQSVKQAIPMLALFAVALARLRGVMSEIANNFTRLRYSLLSVEPVYEDLQYLQQINCEKGLSDVSDAETLHLRDRVSIDDVTFYYENTDTPALSDVTLSFPRGASVAFVGPTGAGKTTMIDLILGLLEPTEGRITVDGTDIQENLRGWQKNIGYIPQFIYLLDDTIRHNIALGIPEEDIDPEMLSRAVSAAQLDEMVERLPEGVDTEVGQRGIRLSGGQRQRIGIARAIYHNPDVLVMDEATSNLDSATERAIVESVNELKGDRTIIMIAHRLTTVQDCDTLYFLREGRLQAQGTYDELLENCPAFREMAP